MSHCPSCGSEGLLACAPPSDSQDVTPAPTEPGEGRHLESKDGDMVTIAHEATASIQQKQAQAMASLWNEIGRGADVGAAVASAAEAHGFGERWTMDTTKHVAAQKDFQTTPLGGK